MAQAYAGQLPRQPVRMQGLSHHELGVRDSYDNQSSRRHISRMTTKLHMMPFANARVAQGSLKTGMYACMTP